jgi:metallo-beta-lactamase family protein
MFMAIALTVWEGSRPGLGACLLLEYEGKRLLLDCGYNEAAALTGALSFPVPADSIHALVLSHGHLGHCGLLPVLVRGGFAGKVHCTTDTHIMALLGMREVALLQQEEKQYWASRAQAEATEPLYTESEVTACQPLFAAQAFGAPVPVDEHLTLAFFRAGHCPGSAFVKMDFRQGDSRRKVLYVGDVGAGDSDLYAEPVTNDSYDGLLLPAFAARQEAGGVEEKLAGIINQTREAGGNVLIPVSSLDRRDAILRIIQNLSVCDRIPSVFVFLDSPVASAQCDILPWEPSGPAVYPCLRPIDTIAESKSLNPIQGTAVILAGASRGGYGRLGFHLKRNAGRPESAIVLFGAQPDRSLGRALAGDGRTLTVLGQTIEVKARVHRLADPTVHLTADGAAAWLGHLKSLPRHICLTHGTPAAQAELRRALQASGIPNVRLPRSGEQVTL